MPKKTFECNLKVKKMQVTHLTYRLKVLILVVIFLIYPLCILIGMKTTLSIMVFINGDSRTSSSQIADYS